MQRTANTVPVCEVKGEMLCGVPVVHIVVLHCVEALVAMPQASKDDRNNVCNCRDKGAHLVASVSTCACNPNSGGVSWEGSPLPEGTEQSFP
jgi:hypothetical protein